MRKCDLLTGGDRFIGGAGVSKAAPSLTGIAAVAAVLGCLFVGRMLFVSACLLIAGIESEGVLV